jgi:hypothetical protein
METNEVKTPKYARLGTKGKIAMVLLHLQEKGSITSWEAIELYGATRLSDIIFKLRNKYDIETIKRPFTDRYGNTSSYGVYIYHGEYKPKAVACENPLFSKIAEGNN